MTTTVAQRRRTLTSTLAHLQLTACATSILKRVQIAKMGMVVVCRTGGRCLASAGSTQKAGPSCQESSEQMNDGTNGF